MRLKMAAIGILGCTLLEACGTTTPASSPPITRPAGQGSANDLPSFGPGSAYHPVVDPANFSPVIDNQWFPLKPGTTLKYTGQKDGKAFSSTYRVTSETVVIGGVTCRVVRDQAFSEGKLTETTIDYYTQDKAGNVWYFGEDTVKLDEAGVMSTSGSWHAGVDGAQPGVFMPANPRVGDRHRQEWNRGNAEDQFKVLSLTASVTVPKGSFQGVMQTEETTALEPAVIDNKYFARGIGKVEEVGVQGVNDKLVLTEVTTS